MLLSLSLEGSLGGLGDLEVTSTGVQAGGLEVERVGGVLGIEAAHSAILVALGVSIDLFSNGSPAFNGGGHSLSEVKDELSSGVSVGISKSLSHIISSSLGGVSPELTELKGIIEESFDGSVVH